MSEATRDLVWVIGIFIAVGVLWILTGGPSRQTTEDKPFLELPVSTSSPTSYYSSAPNYYQPSGSTGTINQAKKVRLSSGSAFYSIYPNQEYVEIAADYNNPKPIDISG